jgi:hypothetical protein
MERKTQLGTALDCAQEKEWFGCRRARRFAGPPPEYRHFQKIRDAGGPK